MNIFTITLSVLFIFFAAFFRQATIKHDPIKPPRYPSTTIVSGQTVSPTFIPTSAPTITTIPTHQTSPVATQAATPNPVASAYTLFIAVNAYRSSHAVHTLTRSTTLCRLAQARASQQAANGGLDNHAGFQAQAASQTEFHHVGEILQYWSEPKTATFLVESGWGQSGEHNAIMLDASWTHGCGATNGYYSVFMFARI